METALDTMKKEGIGFGIKGPKDRKISRLKKVVASLVEDQIRQQTQINALQNQLNVIQHDNKRLIEDMRGVRNGIEEEDE